MSDGVTYKKTKNKKKTMQEIRLERKNESANSRLKAIIIGQRKVFYRQRIPESICERKQSFTRIRN